MSRACTSTSTPRRKTPGRDGFRPARVPLPCAGRRTRLTAPHRAALVAPGALRPGALSAAGGVAEWLKAHAWKVCIRETVSRVRIPLPPPSDRPIARSISRFAQPRPILLRIRSARCPFGMRGRHPAAPAASSPRGGCLGLRAHQHAGRIRLRERVRRVQHQGCLRDGRQGDHQGRPPYMPAPLPSPCAWPRDRLARPAPGWSRV